MKISHTLCMALPYYLKNVFHCDAVGWENKVLRKLLYNQDFLRTNQRR